jgi:hypothetical protein
MCHAAKRLEELRELTELLEQSENQKFFDLLFPKPEEHESSTNRPAIEEILLSRKLRELLVEFARRGDVQLANKAAGIIYENFEILRRLAEIDARSFGGVTTMHFLNTSKNAKKLKRLFDEMKQARLAAVTTLPPPAVEPKVEAA